MTPYLGDGFQVQIRRWWSPFWFQCHDVDRPCNTHTNLEDAKSFLDKHASGAVAQERKDFRDFKRQFKVSDHLS